jgi:hypothetical protein
MITHATLYTQPSKRRKVAAAEPEPPAFRPVALVRSVFPRTRGLSIIAASVVLMHVLGHGCGSTRALGARHGVVHQRGALSAAHAH